MGYSIQFKKGISWIILLRILTRGVIFIRLAILGRLLTPREFGYFGVASLLLSLLEILTETGINVFLVQQKGSVKEYLNSAWVVSIARGIFISLLIILSAGPVSEFFNAKNSYFVILLLSLVPLIRGFINPAIITYQKDLLFNKEFKLRSFLFIVEAVFSIVSGFLTRSAVSFAYGLIASAIFEVILSYALIPLWPKFKLELGKVKHIIYKGWWVTITGIFSYFADNGDNIVVGKILGSASLGIYQVAYKFSTLPISEVSSVVNQVVFPVYTKFSDDKPRLFKAFVKVTVGTLLGGLLTGLVILIFARPIILIFMGGQWVQAVPVVQILAIYGILRTAFGSFSALFLSVGRQDFVAKMILFRIVGLAVLVIPLVRAYGMVGAGYAMLFSVLVEIPFIIYFTFKVFEKDKGNH